MIGSSLGPYKVLEPLGAGGMGDVYLAEDTRLNRKVAVKVLPDEFAADPERLARFEQEARAAAALNHPHIAAVFDVGFAEGRGGTAEDAKTDPSLEAGAIPAAGVHYIVQEYLEGDTVRAPLDKGALPIARALTLGREIAAALGAAHAAGIVHRDLKPENIFITEDGHAKVLDFGLAKLTEAAAPESRMSMSPTMLGTVAGQVMGTAGYMAPEQVEGLEEIDHRADLFAFGCVLYEMVGGKRAFSGPTVLDTLHAIARTEPQPVHEIKPGLPVELGRILGKCLAKDPTARYQHADDLAVDLKNLSAAVESGTATATSIGGEPRKSRWGPPVPLAATAALVAIAALAAIVATRTLTSRPAELMMFDFELPEGVRMNPAAGRSVMAISPDGQTVVYAAVDDSGTQALYRRNIDALKTARIPGSEGALTPGFSPDGEWLTFAADGEIRKLSLEGGTPNRLAAGGAQVPAWGDDGNIYFVQGETLWRVSQAGAVEPEPVHVLEGGETFGLRTQVLPGSRGVLVEVGSTSPRPVYALDLESGELNPIGVAGGRPTYSPAGYVLYAEADTLWARPFDLASLQPTGPPAMVTQGVFTLPSGQARFSISNDHKLIYGPQQEGGSEGDALTWIDADGREIARSPASPGTIAAARTSPDGNRVMVTLVMEDTSTALYAYDVAQQAFSVFNDADDPRLPVWSPDGDHVYFTATVDGDMNIYRQRADLSAAREEVLVAEGRQMVTSITPAGDHLVYHHDVPGGATGWDIWTVSVEPGGVPEPLVVNAENDLYAEVSPDGAWLAYTRGLGPREVWLRRLDGEGPGRKASTDGGSRPGWTPDGGALLYSFRGLMYRVAVELAADATIEPQSLFPVTAAARQLIGARSYDIYGSARAPQLVLSDAVLAGQPGDEADKIIVVLNWLELLRRQTSGQ